MTDFNHRVLSPIKVDILDMINSTNISSYAGLLKILALCDIMCNVREELMYSHLQRLLSFNLIRLQTDYNVLY